MARSSALRALRASLQIKGFAVLQSPDALALFCWLHKDALIAALESEVDLLADDLSQRIFEERATRIAALRAQLLEAERVEEALVCASEQSDAPVLRHNAADPRAVLGLSSALPAPR
jgi:hypothetical protein